MNPWVLFPILLLALGAVAGWLSRRLPSCGGAALVLTAVPLGGAGLMAMF